MLIYLVQVVFLILKQHLTQIFVQTTFNLGIRSPSDQQALYLSKVKLSVTTHYSVSLLCLSSKFLFIFLYAYIFVVNVTNPFMIYSQGSFFIMAITFFFFLFILLVVACYYSLNIGLCQNFSIHLLQCLCKNLLPLSQTQSCLYPNSIALRYFLNQAACGHSEIHSLACCLGPILVVKGTLAYSSRSWLSLCLQEIPPLKMGILSSCHQLRFFVVCDIFHGLSKDTVLHKLSNIFRKQNVSGVFSLAFNMI